MAKQLQPYNGIYYSAIQLIQATKPCTVLNEMGKLKWLRSVYSIYMAFSKRQTLGQKTSRAVGPRTRVGKRTEYKEQRNWKW